MNAVATVVEQPPVVAEGATLLAVIARAAADPNVDVDKMKSLLAMHRDMQRQQAEAEFNQALARVQSNMGRIGTDKRNSQTNSDYATYAKLDRKLRPLYSAEGFALSFGTDPTEKENTVRMTCDVSHRGGHTRRYMIDMPADGKGPKGNDVMTRTHATGSATQYGMRYLLKMIFNVAIASEDDDGNAAGQTTPEQQAAARKAQHDEAFGRHSESIAYIKERIAAGDMQAVADEWGAISQADQMALWLAPSKGGCLTTLERATIKEKLPKKAAQEQQE